MSPLDMNMIVCYKSSFVKFKFNLIKICVKLLEKF